MTFKDYTNSYRITDSEILHQCALDALKSRHHSYNNEILTSIISNPHTSENTFNAIYNSNPSYLILWALCISHITPISMLEQIAVDHRYYFGVHNYLLRNKNLPNYVKDYIHAFKFLNKFS
jgi:hypothetical protein